MSKQAHALVFAVVALWIGTGFAHAEPLGIVYDFQFDAVFSSLEPGALPPVEGHRASITFDGLAELVQGGAANLDLPANDVWVRETTTPNGPDSELIEIWIFGEDAVAQDLPPDPGQFGSLFLNPISTADLVLLSINGLYWTDRPNDSVAVSDIEFFFTEDGGIVPIALLSDLNDFVATTRGTGTQADPLELVAAISALDLIEDATDLHLSFKVAHVPEPAGALVLVGGGFVALLTRRRPTA